MASFDYHDWTIEYLEGEEPGESRTIGFELEGATTIEPEMSDWDGDEDVDDENDNVVEQATEMFSNWRIGGIGSDGDGIEVATEPVTYLVIENGGSDNLNGVLDLWHNIAVAEDSHNSGTHVHIGKLPTDSENTWNNIYWFVLAFYPQITKIFGRRSKWADYPRTSKHIFKCSQSTGYRGEEELITKVPVKRPLNTFSDYGHDKAQMVNVREYGYEFRGPRHTSRKEELFAWAEFCHNIVELCSRDGVSNREFSEFLEGEYLPEYLNSLSPTRQITEEELSSKIKTLGLIEVTVNNDREGGWII